MYGTGVGVIYDAEYIHIIGRYSTIDIAKRMLHNAKTRGHRINGRKYSEDRLARLAVTDIDTFNNEIDGYTSTINLISGKEVRIKKSEKGGVCDPGTERYWSM
jgi:hypothetical protein